MERIRNLRKRRVKSGDETPNTKSKRRVDTTSQNLVKRYPPRQHNLIDENTLKQHQKLMNAEMMKKKPREVILLPLLLQTYSSRRDFIVSSDRTSVREILDEYPGLRLAMAVC